MAIAFTAEKPKTPEYKVLAPGEYPFEIIDAKETKTDKDGPKLKAGTPKIELKLRVNDEVTVFDNLFFSASTFWKVDALLAAIGKHPGAGKDIEIEAWELLQEKGRVRIKKGKTQGGQDRNEVEGYVFDEVK